MAEFVAGLLGLVSVPMGLGLKDWFGETFGASSWVPLYIFGTAFVLLVLYGFFIKAPKDLYVEAMLEIAALKLTIEDKERIQKALNELWRLRAAGVKIRNRRITPDEFEDWLDDFYQWREEVLQHSCEISENLKQWMDVLDQTTQGPVSPHIHSTHHDKLRVFSEVLHRLQKFLERDLVWPKTGT